MFFALMNPAPNVLTIFYGGVSEPHIFIKTLFCFVWGGGAYLLIVVKTDFSVTEFLFKIICF